MTRAVAACVAFALALALVACGDDDDRGAATTTTSSTASTASPTTTSEASADGSTPLGALSLRLTEVAEVDQPLALAVRRDVPGFYLAEKGGRVQYVPAPGEDAQEVLDIADDVSDGGEQGLLGLTFAPAGDRMYVSYTNNDGDTRVDEYAMGDGPTDVGERQDVFAIDQPYGNHNGGNIVFGPDGWLWLGLGDGGAGGDPHNNAQNPDSLLGKLLRLDPETFEPQVYALGLRNPWRFSFDRETGDLWIGDVGQGAVEEIDFLHAGTSPGSNFGWNLLEGTQPYEADEAPGSLLPVFEYGRGEGQSVVGGHVYRGAAHPGLRGTYLFADAYVGELRALRRVGDHTEHHALGVRVPGGVVSSFGEDADGELYVLSLGGGVYRIDQA